MSKLLKKGLKAYSIFLKNKIATSLMMLVPGIMMTFAALNGNGNDTKSLPLMILGAGMVLSFWAFYRIGYIRAYIENPAEGDERGLGRKALIWQILETLLYVAVTGLGIFLLMNEQFTNRVLNLMAGGFTTLNGVLGAIATFKNRHEIDFRWKFVAILTLFELGFGIYFLLAYKDIGIGSYLLMGILTTIAGTLEVASALNVKTIKSTIEDGKDIVKTLKDDDDAEEEAPKELGDGEE